MPEAIAIIASIVIGLALAVAGGTKLADQRRWLVQASGLGVERPLASIVPWVEVIIGVGLIVQLARPVLAAAALVLLVAFTVVLVVNLRRGNRPPCACFGSLSAQPIGARHVVRNVILAAVAVVGML